MNQDQAETKSNVLSSMNPLQTHRPRIPPENGHSLLSPHYAPSKSSPQWISPESMVSLSPQLGTFSASSLLVRRAPVPQFYERQVNR